MHAGVAPFEYCSMTYITQRNNCRMSGSFTFRDEATGEEFDAIINPFSFDVDHSPN